MASIQARIKPEYQHLYQEFEFGTWYDVEPLWPGTRVRRLDMADKRVARIKTSWGYTSLRAEYLEFRKKPSQSEKPPD